MPGWPELAFSTASIESVRIVSMLRRSRSTFARDSVVVIVGGYPRAGFVTVPPHGASGLPLGLAVPRLGGAAPRPPRRGLRLSCRLLPRRADVVVLVAQGDAAGARRRLPLHRARPARLRALRQAGRSRLVH